MKQWQLWSLSIVAGVVLVGGILFFLIARPPAKTSGATASTPLSSANIEQTERALDVAWINTFASDIEQEVAQGLHMSADQLLNQLQAGKTMSQVATTQGLMPAQLQSLELRALRDAGQKAVQAGTVPQAHVDQFLQQAQSDNVYLDEIVTGIFKKHRQKS